MTELTELGVRRTNKYHANYNVCIGGRFCPQNWLPRQVIWNSSFVGHGRGYGHPFHKNTICISRLFVSYNNANNGLFPPNYVTKLRQSTLKSVGVIACLEFLDLQCLMLACPRLCRMPISALLTWKGRHAGFTSSHLANTGCSLVVRWPRVRQCKCCCWDSVTCKNTCTVACIYWNTVHIQRTAITQFTTQVMHLSSVGWDFYGVNL